MGLFEEWRKAAISGKPMEYDKGQGFWTDEEAKQMNMRSLRENRSLDDIMHEELKRKMQRGENDTDLEKITKYQEKKKVIKERNRVKELNESR